MRQIKYHRADEILQTLFDKKDNDTDNAIFVLFRKINKIK